MLCGRHELQEVHVQCAYPSSLSMGRLLHDWLHSADVLGAPQCAACTCAISESNISPTIVCRHFDALLDVDEDDVLSRFMNAVRKSSVAAPLAQVAEASAVGKRTATRKANEGDMIDPDDALDEGGPGTRGRAKAAATDDDRRGGNDGYARGAGVKRGRGGGSAGAQHSSTQGGGYAGGYVQAPMQQDMQGGAGDSEEIYCICQRPAFDEMIGCDNSECPIEWFHVQCVGLDPKNKPKGKWYCPPCRAKGMGGPPGPGAAYGYPQMGPMGAGDGRGDMYRQMGPPGVDPSMMPRGMPMYAGYRPVPGQNMQQAQYMHQQQQQNIQGKKAGGAAGRKAVPQAGMRSSAVPPQPGPGYPMMQPRGAPAMGMPRPYYLAAPPGSMGPPMQYGGPPRGAVMMPGPRGAPAGKPPGGGGR